MIRVTLDEFEKNPAKYIDDALAGTPLRIERNAGSVVVMSEKDFESWQETIHLLRSPANANRLLNAIVAANAGKLLERELIEE
jgi:antitoxin YefM